MLYLFNTTIMPNEGVFTNRKIHLSADALTALLKILVNVNRIPATLQPGDEAIALKVLGRLPEGQILTLEELQEIGFELFHIQRLDDGVYQVSSDGVHKSDFARTFSDINTAAQYAGAYSAVV